MDTSLLTARETARLIALGETSAEEVAHDVLGRAAALNEVTNAYLFLDDRGCLEAARAVDAARAAGQPLGPLAGVPIALKDNFMAAGLPATCGSLILEDYVAPYDGTAVARLREAGLVVVGKTNMDEFAMGSSNENSAFGPVRNPWSLEHVSGGSSGGSAAAVASGAALLALGSDTGGSVREPASFCGVVGYKPTYGRVSRYGLVAFGSSLDQIGPLARDVVDAALLYNTIAGFDPLDATSHPAPAAVDVGRLGDVPHGLRLGVPRTLLADGLDADVRRVLDEALAALADVGLPVVDVELPHLPACVAVYYIVATAEASSNLARYDGVRYGPRAASPSDLLDMYVRTRTEGFGREVKRRIMLGTYALSAGYYDAYYARAQQVRTLIRRDFEAAFARADVLVMPVVPTPAFRIGERVTDPLAMYLTDAFTIPANLAGLPAISVPAGESRQGLPIGVQLLAAPLRDEVTFQAAAALERALGRGLRTRARAGRFA